MCLCETGQGARPDQWISLARHLLRAIPHLDFIAQILWSVYLPQKNPLVFPRKENYHPQVAGFLIKWIFSVSALLPLASCVAPERQNATITARYAPSVTNLAQNVFIKTRLPLNRASVHVDDASAKH